ncbi:MAG: hypothetical protein IKO21_08445 [Fibrobacter sp.]|nr:hypothetical protein [Fibrobacter sp.]
MKHIGFIITILTLLLSLEALAQRYNDFAGIPFGASRETVIEEVMKLGYEPYGQSGEGERVVIPVFMFGELPVQVDFIFNKNDKFYSFEIRTGRVERARLNKSFEAVAYMSEQFTLKYGKPSGNPSIDESSTLKESLLNLYQQWFSQKVLNIYTALVQKDGRYFAVGSVTHRKLAVEKNASSGRAVDKAPTGKPVF